MKCQKKPKFSRLYLENFGFRKNLEKGSIKFFEESLCSEENGEKSKEIF